MPAARLSPRGLAAGTTAFTLWGLFPIYFHSLSAVPALQVIAHRVVWSALLLVAWMAVRGQLGLLPATFTRPAVLARLALTALLISGNWLVWVWSVTHDHIIDVSLGYYINPLVNVLLGVIVLRERLNRPQWGAIGLATLAVLYLALLAGRPPWIASRGGISRLVPVGGKRGIYHGRSGHRGAPDRGRIDHRNPPVPVCVRGARAAVFDRRSPAIHHAEPAAAVRRRALPGELRGGAGRRLRAALGGAVDLRGR
jgi:uncharacterized membrane protein